MNTRQRGFTLIEVVVVLIILMILAGIGLWALTSTRSSGNGLETRAAARLYADAIQRYQTDHGRKVPVLGGVDWPIAAKGPVNTLSIGGSTVRPYITKSVPDIMSRPGASGSRFASIPTSAGGTIVYKPSGSFRFTLEAWFNGRLICSAGDVAATVDQC